MRKALGLAILLILPATLTAVVLTVYPTIYAFAMSLFRWELQNPERPFIGLGNYYYLFNDTRFIHSLAITLGIIPIGMGASFLLGLGLALLLQGQFRLKGPVTTMLLIPMMIAPSIVGFTWRLIFNDQFGIVNYFIRMIFGPDVAIHWWTDPVSALIAIILADLWQGTPFVFIIMLAGLSALPRAPLESAVVDGAGKIQIFRHITMPLLKPVAILVLLFRFFEVATIFDYVMLTTKGGPVDATEMLSVYIYLLAFRWLTMGLAIAASIIFLVLIVAVLMITRRRYPSIFAPGS